MKLVSAVGTRPNFVKMASLVREISKRPEMAHILVHTGQHYDEKMSGSFFRELEIPEPKVNLGIGSGSNAEQTGRIMIEFEKILLVEKPDLVLVLGDVNSTLACALTASKLGIKVAHIESGLRSFDRTMPEEINRILTDQISDYLFITEKSAEANLIAEGIGKERIFFVGNLMIDTLFTHQKKAFHLKVLGEDNYAVLTVHRPSNVDRRESLTKILDIVEAVQKEIKVFWPIHPRTRSNLQEFGLSCDGMENLILSEPLNYLEFANAMMKSKVVLTDSGGIQEETTALNIPCITLRENTERPVTLKEGTNHLTGLDKEKVTHIVNSVLRGEFKKSSGVELWDGRAAERILSVLSGLGQKRTSMSTCLFPLKIFFEIWLFLILPMIGY